MAHTQKARGEDREDSAYHSPKSNHSGTAHVPVASPSGVMTLKQRLAARKEQETGLRQADAHAHPACDEEYEDSSNAKVNLIGSMMNEHAVFSLVTQTSNIGYLDVRGNGLDSAFGWKLIKSMKKQYLRLDFCNGINTKRIRENSIEDLNMTGFLSHNGLFGIEPVGAIFLAHFLRSNTSLTKIQFQRNCVGKDGAKAIAQAIITNSGSLINEVNQMKPVKKRGVNFSKFQTKEIEAIRMNNYNLVDEDIVFLEEYLSRHDCVKELDLKGNPFFSEGVRKLGRYIGVSQTLEIIRLDNVPVSLEGIQLLTKGILANQSLTWIAFPIGITYGNSKELLQVMHQLAVALSRHPKMERWGGTPIRLDYAKKNTMGEYNTMRLLNTGLHADIALFFWVLATCKPTSQSEIEWNPSKVEGDEYPDVKRYSPALLLAISSACHQMRAHLTKVTIAISVDMTGVAQLLYYLAGSESLKTVNLLAYANAKISFEELPKEWHDAGQLPLWFREYMKDGDQRRLWDALWGFVQRTKYLEQFNDVKLKDFKRDSAELQVMLMCECQRDFKAVRQSSEEITLFFGNTCKPEFAFQTTRLLDPKNPYKINLEFVGKNQQAIKSQQDSIAALLLAKGDTSSGTASFPTYVHRICVPHHNTSKQLISTMEHSSCVEEIYIESIESVLAALVKSLCVQNSREKLRRININRYWYPSRKMPPNFSSKQREQLKMLLGWADKARYLESITSSIVGTVDKSDVAKMSLDEFGVLMSGVRIQPTTVHPVYAPSVSYEIFHDTYNYFYPPEEDDGDDNAGNPIYMLLPLHEDFPGHHLKTIHLTNADLKGEIAKIYPDQYAESSKKLWLDKECYRQLSEHRPRTVDGDPLDPDYQDFIRFHWKDGVDIGSRQSAELLSKVHLIDDKKISKGFHFDVLYRILESLMKAPNLSDLDLRGNGLDAADAQVVIKLLGEVNLDSINGIPCQLVVNDDVTTLDFPGGPIALPDNPDDRPEIDEYAEADYAATMSACRAWKGVVLDAGDAKIFEHVVTPKRFPKLTKVAFAKHCISESSMQIVADTLVLHTKIKEATFKECVMNNAASALLTQLLGDMSDHMTTVNNVGIGAQSGGGKEPPVWNDANLALIGRKNCWNMLSMKSDRDASLDLERSISDAGLRGLCSYIRYSATTTHGSTGMPTMKKIDLSFNHMISDAAVAELCRSLMMPSAAPDLEELDLRYCSLLKARSAFELHHLVQRETGHGQGSCKRLTTINGINVKLLIMTAQEAKATAPLIVRMHGGAVEDMHSDWKAPKVPSEADTHFIAHCLHMFPNIPHCHLHMIIAKGDMEEKPANFRIPGHKQMRNTSSPFVKPTKTENYYKKQFGACESFFHACPVSTRLQLSVTPKPDIYYAKEERGLDIPGDDLALLPPVSGSKNAAKSDTIFGATVRSILKVKQRRRKLHGEEDNASRPTKPLYVNNINSLRLHNQYRSLYGFDDVDILEEDIHNDNQTKNRIILQSDVDLSNLFSTVSSLDLQWLGLSKHHMESFAHAINTKDMDLSMLTHLNLNNNTLLDSGVATLMEALVTAGTSLMHLSLSRNGISDAGAAAIAKNLHGMQRLTSISVSQNCIRETGAITLAVRVAGTKGDHVPLLSIDLSQNFCRELGAERWAKTIQKHPTLQFFNYAENEVAYVQNTFFLALVYASVQSPSLAVLDLSNSFCDPGGAPCDPPVDILESLTNDIPSDMFDAKEVAKGVFIRRGGRKK